MTLVAEWTALATKTRDAAFEIFSSAEVPVSIKGYSDEKFLALTLLARTVSNLKGALLLLEAKRVVEARTITRCCLENFYWTVGLAEKGEDFVRKMRDDELSHRKVQGQSIFATQVQLEGDVRERLRTWMKATNRRFGEAKSLSPKHVAAIRKDFEKTYIFYGQLSSDSAHPSVTALNRYVVPHKDDEIGGIDVEPVVKDKASGGYPGG